MRFLFVTCPAREIRNDEMCRQLVAVLYVCFLCVCIKASVNVDYFDVIVVSHIQNKIKIMSTVLPTY